MSPIMQKDDDNVNYMSRQIDTQAPRVESSEISTLDLIHPILHRYRSMQAQLLRDELGEITPMASRVLRYFGDHPGDSQCDLSMHSERDKAQIARLIRALRDRGLLIGKKIESDKRSVGIWLTEEGHGLLKVIQIQSMRLNAIALHKLSAAERRLLAKLLTRVADNLDGAKR
jgi:DNA-binding MarR family transcriptional regulator